MKKKHQLIAIILGLTVLSSVVIVSSSFLTRNKVAQTILDGEIRSNLALAGQAASLLGEEIKNIEDKVMLVAKLPQIQGSDSRACNQKLAEVAPYLQGQVDNITRLNTSFTLDCAINQNAIGYVVAPESEIIALIRNPEHPPNLSRSGYSPVSDQYVLYLTVPVFSQDGTYYGVIGGVTYLNYIADKYLTSIKTEEGSYFILLDDDGTFLYHPDKRYIGKKIDSSEVRSFSGDRSGLDDLNGLAVEASRSGKTGSLEYSSMGKDVISAYAPAHVFPGRTWTVILTVPVEAVLAKHGLSGLNVFILLSGSIVLILIIFSAVILFYTIMGIFKPLEKIRDAADKVSEGNLEISLETNILYAKNEFGKLARAVKGMATKLGESYASLEKKVEERTKSLNDRTQELERTNKFMIGREIKMAELKDENAKLKAKLGIKDNDKT